MDFLDPDNIAGQSLLQLVARGSSIITEMMRLSDHIPPAFLGVFEPNQDVARYKAILPDFHYLKAAEKYDAVIDNDRETVDLDEEFRENNMELLERFYSLFESLHKYVENLNSWIRDMEAGSFLQMTIDGILMEKDGKQLLCEAVYLYGCMLLLLDMRVPGKTRERMIISYYRYKGATHLHNLDDIVVLCRDTGFSITGKRPANYPEEFFARVPIPANVIDMILGRLRSDDIYNHTSAFPLPAHRSTALSNQASMLYVCLYFAPEHLQNSIPICREIVDKYYADNWVIPLYMGYLVDITEAWEPYKAAKNALKNAVTSSVTKECVKKHKVTLSSACLQLDEYLTEGVLTDDYVMDNYRKLLDHTRVCNVALRWLILHRSTSNVKIRDMVKNEVPTEDVLRLLLQTSQFEFLIRSTIRRLLDNKVNRWDNYKALAAELTTELSDVFSGARSLSRVKKSEKLTKWFRNISDEILGISISNSVVAGRTLSELLKALDAVGEYHQVDSVLQVKQYLADVKLILQNMVRLANITPKILGDMDIIVDFTYAKRQMKAYTPLIHEKISKDPSVCLLLRATFLKLSSLLTSPLVRVIQSQSADDVSVAHYYSSELVTYVRSVLEIVPVSVFRLLDAITELRLGTLKELLPKIERTHIKDYAQANDRFTLSRYTNSVSVFTGGILNMQTTLLGIIKLNPQQTLEDGLRKQVVRQVATAMDTHLEFSSGKVRDMETKLVTLSRKLSGYCASLEYVQDYVNIYGLKVWQEELSRIINYSVEQECNQFLKHKVYDWQSKYQSDSIPVPIFPRSKDSEQGKYVNFTGRLIGELLRQVSVTRTCYVSSRLSWVINDGYAPTSVNIDNETVGLRIFSLLKKSLGVYGLIGLDRLVSFMIVRDLGSFIKNYQRVFTVREIVQFLSTLQNELTPTSRFPSNGIRIYDDALRKTEKLWPVMTTLITNIGQQQLLRCHFNYELQFTAKLDSKVLHSALMTTNSALLSDLQAHYDDPETHKYPENPLLPQVSTYLDAMGTSEPIDKIYLTTDTLSYLPLALFLFTLYSIQKLQWSKTISSLVSNEKRPGVDGPPLILGLITILKQVHTTNTHMYLNFLGQYVRSQVSSIDGKQKKTELPENATKILMFLDEFCKFSKISRKSIDSIVPSYLFDCFERV